MNILNRIKAMTAPLLCGAVIAAFTAICPMESAGQADLARIMRNNAKKTQRQTGTARPKTKVKANAQPAKRTRTTTSSSSNASSPRATPASRPDEEKNNNEFTAVHEQIIVKEPAKEETTETSKHVFSAVEQQATFIGGQAALMQWIRDHIRYPETAQNNGVTGRVIVRFIVEPNGAITSATIVRSVDKDLDQEALRVVREMPKWEPGKNNGQPVRSFYNLPVSFKL